MYISNVFSVVKGDFTHTEAMERTEFIQFVAEYPQWIVLAACIGVFVVDTEKAARITARFPSLTCFYSHV